MECATISRDVDGGPEAFLIRTPKARKEHVCCECRRIISAGETYTKESGIWDGHPNSYKTCSDCLSIRNAFFDGGYYYEQIFEDLREHISDLDGAMPAKCFTELTDKAKDKVFSMMDDYIQDCE